MRPRFGATNPESTDEAADVDVAGGGKDGIGGITAPEPKIVAAHAVFGLEMADDGLDGGPAAQFALDLRRDPSLLVGDKDPELVIGRCIVAAIALVGEDARDGAADDQRIHVPDHGLQGVAIIRIARQRLHTGDELATLAVLEVQRTVRFYIWKPKQALINLHSCMHIL